MSNTPLSIAARATLDAALRLPHDRLPGSLAFEGRDHYVAFVALWKADYAEVVRQIHAAKAVRRDKGNPVDARNAAQVERQCLRGEARGLLAVRLAGKAVARAERAAAVAKAA